MLCITYNFIHNYIYFNVIPTMNYYKGNNSHDYITS